MSERAQRRYLNTGKKVLAFAAAYGSVCLTGLFCYLYLSTFIWQERDIYYPILHFLNDNKITILLAGLLGGIVIILFYDYKKMYELVEEDVKGAEQRADEAEQLKNDLVVYLAHDLKTPLTSVMGYLELLQDEPELPEETRQHYIQVIARKTERLEDLINEFFEITRYNLTHITLEKSEINLTRLLEQVIFEFQPMMLEKNLTCDVSLPKDFMFVCDSDRMQRVFDNLLRNALNYSYPSTVVRVSLEEREREIELNFENQGNTIPPEKLQRIFEQFFRLDTSRGTKTGGSGIGLAIAKEITQLHGGQITAFSEDNWIRFQIILPR